jgi:hypothetical protein
MMAAGEFSIEIIFMRWLSKMTERQQTRWNLTSKLLRRLAVVVAPGMPGLFWVEGMD